MATPKGPRIDPPYVPDEGGGGTRITGVPGNPYGGIPASDYTPPSDYLNPPPGGAVPGSPAVLKRTAAKLPRALSVSAEGALVNLLYGRVAVQPKIFAIGTLGDDLVIGLLLGKGECNQIEAVLANSETLPAAKVHNYTGTTGQTYDSWLNSAISGYTDNLKGYCYSVIKVSTADFNTVPRFSAIVQGRKIYDPRISSTTYSENPAIMFRDLAILGGLAVDDVSISATADESDGLVGGKKRRRAGVVFDRPNSIDDLLETLAAYAGGLYVRDSGLAKLIPNRPAVSVASFTDVETDSTRFKILQDSLRVRKVSTENQPNRVVVEYTDTTTLPWRRAFAVAPITPPSDPRTTRLILPGVQDYAQAYREAVERLNYYVLTDLEAGFAVFDEGLEVEAGDVIDLTHGDGLGQKQFRLQTVGTADDVGHWALFGREYDPGQYSNETPSSPTFPDTDLPSPADVPDGPTPVVVDKNFTDEMGNTYSILEVIFAGVSWPWAAQYRVRVSTGTLVVLETNVAALGTATHTVPTSAVAQVDASGQPITYLVEVWVVNGWGGISENPGFAYKIADGKSLGPGNVPAGTLVGVEAGQFVSLEWGAAQDTDLKGYLIRRLAKADWDGVTSGDDYDRWEHANVVQVSARNDSTRALLPNQPVGEFYYGVKAIDKVYPKPYPTPYPEDPTKAGREKHESDIARWTFVPVTADGAGAVSLVQLGVARAAWSWDSTVINWANSDWDFSGVVFTAGSLVNMHVYEIYGDGVFAVTSSGRTWSQIFGAAGTSWDTNKAAAEKWFTGQTVASEIFTEFWDTLADRTATWNWLGEIEHTGGGTISKFVALAKQATPSTWVNHVGDSVNAEGRYMRAVIKLNAVADNGFKIRMPVNATFQGKISEFSGSETLAASGQPTAVTFAVAYGGIPKVTAQIIGQTSGQPIIDNVTATGFDLYLWDYLGAAIAGTVEWQSIGT